MTEVRVSERSDMDPEGVGDGSSDAPMDVAMEMATELPPITAETTGATIFEPMERNENGKRRSRSETTATTFAPSDWKSRMERTIRQQTQELMQLRQTVGHLANLMEARAASKEAQCLAMITWMQEREQMWDTCHEDDKEWGVGITNIIAKEMKGVAPGQDLREKKREQTARMDCGRVEALQHADTTREEGPEQRQQPQQQRMPKLQLKLQLKPECAPKASQHPHPPQGGRLSHTEPRGRARAKP
jgi:hypothetical protein